MGRHGVGEQNMSLDSARCGIGSTAHEFGHALGLWHEQSRSDRDNYVYINSQYVQKDKNNKTLTNFHKFASNEILFENVIPYDFGSIMHYPESVRFLNNTLTR